MPDTEEYANITSLCTTPGYYGEKEGRKIIPMQLSLGTAFYHRTFLKYPYCMDTDVCTTSDIDKWYEYITSVVEENLSFYYEEDLFDIEMKTSLKNSCDEYVSDKAFMKQYKGKATIKSCKWLKRRPESLKSKYCNKKVGSDDYEVAGVVCSSTCCNCKEESSNVFLKKWEIDDEGTLIYVTKTCNWLKSKSEEVINLNCGKSAASYIKGYPPAYVACPETRGFCGSE